MAPHICIKELNTLTGVFLLEKIMNEETKTILKYIRDATDVNKKYFAEQERKRLERYEHSR